MPDLYDKAVNLFTQKDFYSAENILTDLIQNNQQDFDILNFLGVIKLNLKDYNSAVYYFLQVISSYEQYPEAYYNLGYSYQMLKQFDDAVFYYQKMLEINFNHFDTKNNLALVYFEQKQFDKAEELLKELASANPDNAKAQNNLGNFFFKSRNFDEAVKYYRAAVEIDRYPDYQYNLALCYLKMDYYESAFQSFNKVIQAKPNHLFSIIHIGIIATKLKSFEKAEKIFNDLLPANNEEPEVFFNLGFCYEEQGKYNLALNCYEEYLALEPNSIPGTIRSAYVLSKLGKVNEARELYDKHLQDDAEKELTFIDMGYTKLKSGNVHDALSFFEDALKVKPDSVELHYGKAHCQLLLSDFKNGWEEYEWRIKKPEFPVRNLKKPRLTNQNINGKKILVYMEQGLGDTIQFIRYLPMLKEKGAYVIFECSEYLLKILKDFPGYDKRIDVVNVSEGDLDYDYHIPILSLPFYFRTELETIPGGVPYLQVDESKKEKWEEIIPPNNKFKVGIVWAGNTKHRADRERSCPLEKFKPVIDRNDIEIYSLQHGSASVQLTEEYKKVHDIRDYNFDLTDAAAAILNLDLLITVDTSLAHLAGALGKSVWLLIALSPDWRWMLDRDNTPWYPAMKLYRQTRPYDWVSVFERVNEDLSLLIDSKKNKDLAEKYLAPQKSKVEKDEPLFLAMTKGENFGWAVCSNYLKKELSKKNNVIDINDDAGLLSQKIVKGKVVHAIKGLNFDKLIDISGSENFGYTFFENELTKTSLENSKQYDRIFAGSTWGLEKLIEKGIKNSDLLIQGIDPEIFHPVEDKLNPDLFVIFSGGKFELRKGQDLVLRAIKILQQKYNDVVLINAWYNSWPTTMESMKKSCHIKYVYHGKNWTEIMRSIYLVNGLNIDRIITLPLAQNSEMAGIYSQTNIGLFPNRCEAGTNLVLMEYMACGKPVVASFNTGHKDILTPENSIMLNEMNDFKLYDADKNLTADWKEPVFDELIAKLEYAYFNRDEIKTIGKTAAQDMKNYTWTNTAENLLTLIK
ncbi:MAG: tetratricopeptide repeat protein [Ignavibacteriaceae bacterium]